MDSITNLVTVMASSIVDEPDKMQVSLSEENSTLSYDIRVSKSDTGKLIGKQGRVASALRTIAKSAGAKAGVRVQVNVSKTPVGALPEAAKEEGSSNNSADQ